MYSPVSAAEAVKVIKSGDRVFIQSAAAAPSELLQAMVDRADTLRNVEVIHLHIDGPAPHTNPEYEKSFRINNLFTGPNARNVIPSGNGSFVPIFLSEVPILFRRGVIKLDVAMVHVSPPDRHGYCSLGTSVDATRAAVQSAAHVIALVNPQMPRTHGDGLIHIGDFDEFVEIDRPVHAHPSKEPSEIEMTIGRNIAELVEDGSTLQMGIGAIPDAALRQMHGHKDLGIHTEMFSDGVVDLFESGAITNKYKKSHPGKIISGFVMGSQRLYDFIDDNPLVNMLDIGWVNDVAVIRRNPKVTAINSAIEVDITGQVCADSIGNRIYSGVGGQMDFMRGAMLSEGGKPIIALPSVTSKGVSRITPMLKPAAGVVTTRAHVNYIITEYGVASLFGKNIHQRMRALIGIAHPDHREWLTEEADKLWGLENNIYYLG